MADQEFEVVISRSAVETVTIKVKAASQDAADERIGTFLDQPHRVELSDLDKLDGVKVTGCSFSGDDESSWEICC